MHRALIERRYVLQLRGPSAFGAAGKQRGTASALYAVMLPTTITEGDRSHSIAALVFSRLRW